MRVQQIKERIIVVQTGRDLDALIINTMALAQYLLDHKDMEMEVTIKFIRQRNNS